MTVCPLYITVKHSKRNGRRKIKREEQDNNKKIKRKKDPQKIKIKKGHVSNA